ncbi:MAG: dephospho-CoA kinase [Bdellovibrionota bacterium]
MDTVDTCKDWGIGLTGGIATGKSTVGEILRSQGVVVIDADALARKATEVGSPVIDEIVAVFGSGVLDASGALDRGRMRGVVFNDKEKLLRLESIIHPQIQMLLKEELEQADLFSRPRLWFYEAALLIEKNMQDRFRQIWLTYCGQKLQLERILSRNKFTKQLAQQIIDSQLPDSEKMKYADVILDSNCSMDELRRKVLGALKACLMAVI